MGAIRLRSDLYGFTYHSFGRRIIAKLKFEAAQEVERRNVIGIRAYELQVEAPCLWEIASLV